MKNKLVLRFTWKDADPEFIELYNVNKIDVYIDTEKADFFFYRIECDGRFYYFAKSRTTIESFEILQ